MSIELVLNHLHSPIPAQEVPKMVGAASVFSLLGAMGIAFTATPNGTTILASLSAAVPPIALVASAIFLLIGLYLTLRLCCATTDQRKTSESKNDPSPVLPPALEVRVVTISKINKKPYREATPEEINEALLLEYENRKRILENTGALVFVEGLDQDMNRLPGGSIKTSERSNWQDICDQFPNGVPAQDRLTDMQKMVIYTYGMPKIMFYLGNIPSLKSPQ